MRNHHWIVGFIVVAVLLGGASANAQNQGGGLRGGGRGGFGMGGPGGGGSVVALAVHPAAQKEIALKEDEVAAVQKIGDAFREEMMGEVEKAGLGFGGFGQFADLKAEEREVKMREMNETRMAIMKKLNDKFIPQLKETLSAAQFERLQQINWQASGSQALPGPELSKILVLNQEQQDKIGAINHEYGAKQRELFGFGGPRGGGGAGGGADGPPDFQAMRTKMLELTKERDGKAIEVLAKEQQEKYASLKGKPFDVSQLIPMGPGGPGGRGGGPAGRPQGGAGRPEKKAE